MDNISNCLNQNLESLPSVGYAYLKDSRICRIIKSLIPYPHAAMCEFRQRTAAGWLSLAKMFAFLLLLLLPMAAMAQPYIITGSGEAFTATKDGETVGTADQPIQTVIDDIRTYAAEDDVAIQFGENGEELDIGEAYITFGSDTPAWGKITLSGKITGASTSSSYGTISLTDAVSVESSADIKNTGVGGYAIHNGGDGTVSISGGEISATTGIAVGSSSGKITISGTANITSARTTITSGTIYLANSGTDTDTRLEITGGTITNTAAANGNAVYNASIGAISISGGEISVTTGSAVYNASTGAVSISGGTISATTGYAVRNNSTGKITVSGTANITSTDVSSNDGTIYLAGSGNTATRLEITGGTIKNTAAYGTAVYNNSTGAVSISGGEISATATSGTAVYNEYTGAVSISGGTISVTATSGYAVFNNGTGAVSISGGTISATNGYAFENKSTGSVVISGGTISVTTGSAIYNASTGAISISGGEISATTGMAVYNVSTGKITVSGTANITSARTTTTSGTIYLANSGTNTATRLEIIGGTITNTAANGNVVYNASTGAVSIGGSPAITGRISVPAGNLSVITEGENIFAPAAKEYTLNLTGTQAAGNIAVTGGAEFMPNFSLVNANFYLKPNNGNIVLTNVQVFTVAVTNGTGSNNYGYYEVGETVTLTANTAPEGKRFKEWSITPAVTYLNGTSKTSEEAEFAMPAQAVTATAIYEDLPPTHYAIEITTDGNGIANPSATSAPQGAEITLTVTPNAGYLFKEWQVISGGVTITDNKFTMPNVAVEIKAVFEAEQTPVISNRIAAGSIMAQAIGKDIVLSNLPQNAKVEVFGLNGKRVGVQNFEPVHGALRITVQTKGVYVVKAGGQSLRVVVK